MPRLSSVTVHVLLIVKLLVKLGTVLLTGPTENNVPYVLQCVFKIQKLYWASDEGFKIASCVARQTRYLHSIQLRRITI